MSKNSIILFTTTYLPRLEQEEKWSWGGGGGRGVGDAHIDRQGKTTLDPAGLEH